MRLSAIYIEEHKYLFDKPQTVNFGGRFYYEFKKEGNNLVVKRKLNDKFIEQFFDLPKLSTKITLLNAIVGQNGAGKSSLLDIIRNSFIEISKSGLPYTNALFLYEIDNEEKPFILNGEFDKVYLEEEVKNDTSRVSLRSLRDKQVQTIYYSPHFDYKYDPDFDNADDYDISFDKLIEDDLENLNSKDDSINEHTLSPLQELLFKASLRQIEFLSSDLVNKQKIFKDLFELQEHYEPTLVVRSYTDYKDYSNIPWELNSPIENIEKKIEEELDEFRKNRIGTQVEVTGYFLKRNFLKAVISLLRKQMSRYNLYFGNRRSPLEVFDEQFENFDSYTSLVFFSENASLESGNKTKKIFKKGSLKNWIDAFYKAVDNAKTEDEVNNSTLKTSKEAAITILNLQREFLSELNRYYSLFDDPNKLISKGRHRIEEIINYMPFSRRMSSGENALLNLFAGLYNFVNYNFKDNKFLEENQHYILLLDEADLSFHPSWKKRYVKAILKTIPYFFNELVNHPSVQIIFTTHDPLTLSDLPNSNVVYLERRNYNSKTKVLDYNDENRPTKTFGANISNLLADSFFVEDSLIGEFAYEKIQKAIKWLNDADDKENTEYYEKLIQSVDEPIVQRKLSEMFDDKMQTQFQITIVDEQIRALEELRKKLKK